MLTEVSPLLNFLSSHSAGLVPSRSQIASTRDGCEDPEKILIWRIAIGRSIAMSESFVGGYTEFLYDKRILACSYSYKAGVEKVVGEREIEILYREVRLCDDPSV